MKLLLFLMLLYPIEDCIVLGVIDSRTIVVFVSVKKDSFKAKKISLYGLKDYGDSARNVLLEKIHGKNVYIEALPSQWRENSNIREGVLYLDSVNINEFVFNKFE